MLADAGQPPAPAPKNLSPEDVDKLLAQVTERREQLLALLRKSVELNEPLIVG